MWVQIYVQFKPRIVFDGTTNVDEGTTAKESRNLNHSLNNLSINDTPLTENIRLVDFEGLMFRVSFVKYVVN